MEFDLRKYRTIQTADFETSTDKWGVDKARVWLWDICYQNLHHKTGKTLDGFMHVILSTAWNTLYGFRNLAYDGVYILNWLLKNGYKYTKRKKEEMPRKTFTCVISSLGQHYAYCICTENNGHCTIFDTLKYVNMSIEKSAKQYNLPIKKGTIDYDLYRPEGYTPTEDEIEYIRNDTEIDMRTLILNMQEGAVKFTQAGNARNEFKKLFTKGEWETLFPDIGLEIDKQCRKAYKGGFVQYNPKYVNKDVFNMMSFDINSMYPAHMLHKPMPYGMPEGFSGKYKPNDKYPIYIQKLLCSFHLKEDGIPMIASSRVFINQENAYLTTSGLKQMELTLASPDLELFFDNYNVYNIEWLGGFMFMEKHGYEVTPEEAPKMTVDEVIELDGKGSYFYEYIKKWRFKKEHEKSGSPARDYAKRMQNALYGALATNPDRRCSIPYLDENDIVRYRIEDSDNGKSYYLPAGIFITAWSRYFLIKTIMKYKDIFVYCDTDSLYLICDKPPQGLNIHKSLYGFFKVEHIIEKFKVVGAKRYIYHGREPDENENRLYVTCCGADEDIKKQMNFDTFYQGAVFHGKKSVHNVSGGKHLFITTYKLGKPPA